MKIIVIGAGPSGLMCAYKLKEKEPSCDVLLIEKNHKVGRKLYISGKGRCNFTNSCDRETFFINVVSNPRFLYSAYSNFSSQDTIDFFSSKKLDITVERGNRVFPASNKSSDVIDTLYYSCLDRHVKINLNETVENIYKDNDSFVVKTNRSSYEANKVIIATGGLSYPLTGSTGDGYRFAKSFSHTIIKPVPSLVCFNVKDAIPSSLYKYTLKNVLLKVSVTNKCYEEFGEVTFYKNKVGGACALTLSSKINRCDDKNVSLSLDLKPALTNEKLSLRIQRECQNNINKNIKDVIHKLLPKEMVDFFIRSSKISTSIDIKNISKADRDYIVNHLKDFRFNYLSLDSIESAIVTAGGINVKEINPNTMESKIVKGLYFIGEVVDIDCLTGGFNIQSAFSMGALVSNKIFDVNN